MNHEGDLLIDIAASGAAAHLPEPWRSRVLDAAEYAKAERAFVDALRARRDGYGPRVLMTRPSRNVARINPKGAA